MGVVMKTKVNMDLKVYEVISDAAKKLDTSRAKVIQQVLEYFLKDHKKVKFERNVEYQKSYIELNENIMLNDKQYSEEISSQKFKIEYKQFTLSLNEIQYESFTSMRQFFKMSVSLIISVAVKKYLKYLLPAENTHVPHMGANYAQINFPGYGLLVERTNTGYKFTVWWGYPE